MSDDLEERVFRLETFQQELLAKIADLAPTINGAIYSMDERIAVIEHQFKELEKWHKRMWVVTEAERKLEKLKNTSGEGANPKYRLKSLASVNLTKDDVAELAQTFDMTTTLGKRERDVAIDYWVTMRPIKEMGEEWEVSGARIQQIAHKALRKIKHRKIARKILGADAPF